MQVSGLRIAGGATRKGVPSNGGSNLQPNPAFVKGGSTTALANVPNSAVPDSGYDINAAGKLSRKKIGFFLVSRPLRGLGVGGGKGRATKKKELKLYFLSN